MWVAFANAKATHIFSAKNISIHAIFNDQSFNDMLTNDIVSFEQLGSENKKIYHMTFAGEDTDQPAYLCSINPCPAE